MSIFSPDRSQPFNPNLSGNRALEAVARLSGEYGRPRILIFRSFKLTTNRSFRMPSLGFLPQHILGTIIPYPVQDDVSKIVVPNLPPDLARFPNEKYQLVPLDVTKQTGLSYVEEMARLYIGQENDVRLRKGETQVVMSIFTLREVNDEAAAVITLRMEWENESYYTDNLNINFSPSVALTVSPGLALGLANESGVTDHMMFAGFQYLVGAPYAITDVGIRQSFGVISTGIAQGWITGEFQLPPGNHGSHPYWAWRPYQNTRPPTSIFTRAFSSRYLHYHDQFEARVSFAVRDPNSVAPWRYDPKTSEEIAEFIQQNPLAPGEPFPTFPDYVSDSDGVGITFTWITSWDVFNDFGQATANPVLINYGNNPMVNHQVDFIIYTFSGYGNSPIEWEFENWFQSEIIVVVTNLQNESYCAGIMTAGRFIYGGNYERNKLYFIDPYSHKFVRTFRGGTVSWMTLE